MQDDAFEWDNAKAARNVRDHGISFENPFTVEWIDDRQLAGEQHFLILGMVEDRLLFVCYTLKGMRIRIISARKAEPHE